MRLPQFLIIGAMKAGTTTLFRDLILNPRIFRPEDKEIGHLRDDGIYTDAVRNDYEKMFRNAKPDQICFEASTRYTQLPLHPGVPERARKVLGPDIKIIYLVREPLSRSISHHRQVHGVNWCGPDVNVEVRQYPFILDFSRYAMQLKPWLAVFGPDQVRTIRFETYTRNRREVVAELSAFLDLEPCVDAIKVDTAYNTTAKKPAMRGLWRAVATSRVYRSLLRPLVPLGAREFLREVLVAKVNPRLPAPTEETLDYMIEQLREDQEELKTLPGCSLLEWDLVAAKAKILADTKSGKSESVSLDG